MDAARRAKYEELLTGTRHEIQDLDAKMERELEEVKKRLAGLRDEKDAHLIVYDGYCRLLGVANDLVSDDNDDEDDDF